MIASRNIQGHDAVPEESKDLIKFVQEQEGRVDGTTARRFVNQIFYSGQDLIDLDVELKLNIYESLANDTTPGNENNAEYLHALNLEMGLTKDFFMAQTKEYKEFFSAENKATLEQRWTELGHDGSFAEAMSRQINKVNFSLADDEEAQRLIGFTMASYAEFVGKDAPNMYLADEDPKSCGAQWNDEDGCSNVKLNGNAAKFETGGFLAVLDTAMHEMRHGRQHDMADAYLAGTIKRGDDHYIAARVWAANLKTENGYIEPEDKVVGYNGYHKQPTEIDARNCGQAAAAFAYQTYGCTQPKQETQPVQKQIAAKPASFATENEGVSARHLTRVVFPASVDGRTATAVVLAASSGKLDFPRDAKNGSEFALTA